MVLSALRRQNMVIQMEMKGIINPKKSLEGSIETFIHNYDALNFRGDYMWRLPLVDFRILVGELLGLEALLPTPSRQRT